MSDPVHQSKMINMKEEELSTYLPIPQVVLGLQGKGLNFMSGRVHLCHTFVKPLKDQIEVETPDEPSYISDFALLCFWCNSEIILFP